MLKVGLTGGIASGKSSAAGAFRKLGVPLIDADQVARDVVMPGQPALDEIALRFGAGMQLPDGSLDRKALRQVVFADTDARRDLERITHPRIRHRITAWLERQTAPYVILESPLLLETSQRELVDRVLLIDVPEEVQLRRAMLRDGCSQEQAQAIINAQMQRTLRLEQADDIIVNDSTPEALELAVTKQHEHYLKIAG